MSSVSNKYIDTFIDNYVGAFRSYIRSKFTVRISGLVDFIAADDRDITLLTSKLHLCGFDVSFCNGQDTIDEIQVEYVCNDKEGQPERLKYSIDNLIFIIGLSSKTDISVIGILTMRIVSRIICKFKTIYKAVALDLDDTLWKGTLAEVGFDDIKQTLRTDEAMPFVAFMLFIKAMAKELGLYVAICSRNDIATVQRAIDGLSEAEFPIKNQVDCIVTNYNDKSKNIEAIAQKLSILPKSIVFIDDNQIVRDEVRRNLPGVFVPDWNSHEELMTALMVCCIFDRFELSLNARRRKRQFSIIQQERINNALPKLYIGVRVDTEHRDAKRLYAKSNQFKTNFNSIPQSSEEKSLIFEIYRDNGEYLGICGALTYTETANSVEVVEWAISCRYFEIGLEEYILLYIGQMANFKNVRLRFMRNDTNIKAQELIDKYIDYYDSSKGQIIGLKYNHQFINVLQSNTNLKELNK